MEEYYKLESIFSTISRLEGAKSILFWDASVTMPKGAAAIRGKQISAIDSAIFNHLAAPDVEKYLEKSENFHLNDWQKANLNQMKKIWQHKMSIPTELNEKLVVAQSKAEIVWRDAKVQNDYKSFSSSLSEVLSLVREIAFLKSEKFGLEPYDVLLDQ